MVKHALIAVTLILASATLFAQRDDEIQALKKEIEALKAAQAAMQRDLQEIKQLLARQLPGQPQLPASVSIGGFPSKGSATARLTLVEFSDYQ